MAPKYLKRTKISETAEPKKRQTLAEKRALAEKNLADAEKQLADAAAQQKKEERPRGKGKGMAGPPPSVPEPQPAKKETRKKAKKEDEEPQSAPAKKETKKKAKTEAEEAKKEPQSAPAKKETSKKAKTEAEEAKKEPQSAQAKKEMRKLEQEKQKRAIVENKQSRKNFKIIQENLKKKMQAEKKKMTKKNPNAPKAPAMGAYGVFLQEKREEIQKDLSSRRSHNSAKPSIAEVTKEAGARWKALGEAEKKVYEEQYAVKAAAYKKELEEFKKGGGQTRVADPKAAGMKLKKNPLAPKRVTAGGYGVFLEEQRQEIKKGINPYRRSVAAIAKEAGKQWKALGSPDRRAYKEKFATKSAAYKKELEDFKASGGKVQVVDMKVKRQKKSPSESAEEKRKREDDAARAAVDRMRAARSALVGA